MKKIIIIEKIHKSAINILESRKDFNYEIIENLDFNILKKKINGIQWQIKQYLQVK